MEDLLFGEVRDEFEGHEYVVLVRTLSVPLLGMGAYRCRLKTSSVSLFDFQRYRLGIAGVLARALDHRVRAPFLLDPKGASLSAVCPTCCLGADGVVQSFSRGPRPCCLQTWYKCTSSCAQPPQLCVWRVGRPYVSRRNDCDAGPQAAT